MLNDILLNSVLGAIVGFLSVPVFGYLLPVGLLAPPVVMMAAAITFMLARGKWSMAGMNGLAIMIGAAVALGTFYLTLYLFL